MKTGRIFRPIFGQVLAAGLFAVTMLTAGAWAQEYPQGPNGEAAPASEDPQPDVARISLIKGDVSTQRGDTGDWAVTSVNAPLVRGDQVATGENARTEVQLDYANIVRLAARSQIKIADLTRSRIQVQVAQGYTSYTIFKGSEAEVEIDSPNAAVRPLKPGRYRVQVNSDAETDVVVRDGEAEITTPQGSTRVRSGEMITIRGADNPEYRVSSAPGKDDWDVWNKDRDNVIKQAEGWNKTNRYYTGVNDLDGHGHWVWVPGYGNVWQPYQQAAWAPYQSGRWVWEPYYGWTWVSYEPWGWAPYHYGRWFYYGSSWCWWPGPVYVHYRPLWSPAFVFFVGFGHRSGFGFGSIGWLPVGPHDPFYPWYGRGFNRVNVVNVTNITNITNITNVNNRYAVPPLGRRGHEPYYSNANLALTNPRVRGAITSVSSENFGRGGSNGWRHGVEEHEWREAHVMTAQVPVVPSRESLHAGRGDATPGNVRPRNVDRFYTRHQPPAGPESFHDQMQRVQRVVGPEAAGASSGNQGNVRTDVHAGPGQVDRRDLDRSGGSNPGPNRTNAGNEKGKEGSPSGSRRFGDGNGPNNAGIGPGAGPGPKESPGRMAPGVEEEKAQKNPPAANSSSKEGSSGSSAQDNRRGDRGGWNKFGPPAGRSGGDGGNAGRPEQTPASRSNDQGRVPRTDSTPEPRKGGDSPNWQKFPSTGERQGDRGPGDRQTGDRGGQSPDRGGTPAIQTPPARTQDDRGGWQKFPSNSDHGSRPSDVPANRNDKTDSTDRQGGNSKPPLELHRPIVTPRQPEVRNEQRSTPPPARTPEVRNEPRYSPPQRSEPRYTPPPQRSEPRSSPPPQRTESRHESHGSSGSSSHSGGSDRGSHDSKSSSNPKQR